MLLERDKELALLGNLMARAGLGRGHTVMISGEAGIGKTALTREFLRQNEGAARVLRGSCEDLSIAEPLAPLRDLAREGGWELPENLGAQGDRLSVFSEALEVLNAPNLPTIVMIEDLHWADDATLDFLRFLTRRIDDMAVLLLITSRDTPSEGRLQIRRVIGGLPSEVVSRIALAPLSKDAVNVLSVDGQRDAEAVYRLAGGNAFYVTELLRSPDGTLPVSVQDSVLARAETLSAGARDVLNAVSIFTRRAERELVEAICPDTAASIEDSIRLGLLEEDGGYLTFRHELARQAIENDLPGSVRRDMNARLLRCLSDQHPGLHSRLVHHADAAGDTEAILRHASRAAEDALTFGSMREAVGFLKLALDHSEALSAPERADMLQKHAWASYHIGNIQDAIRSELEALELFKEQGEVIREGDSYRRLSRFHWVKSSGQAARDYSQKAVTTLAEQRGPELALALSTRAQLAMLDNDYEAVAAPSQMAMQLAEEFDRPEIMAHSLNNLGMSLVWSDPERGRSLLRKSLDTALAAKSYHDAARSYVNWAFFELYRLNYREAIHIAERGVKLNRETDQLPMGVYAAGAIAWAHVQLGEFDAAFERARAHFSTDAIDELGRGFVFSAAIPLLWVSMRRGDDVDPSVLKYLEDFIAEMDELQRFDVYAEVMAERAWLGLLDRDRAIEILKTAIRRTKEKASLAYVHLWLRKLSPETVIDIEPTLVAPARLQLEGRWREAAEAWAATDTPFFQALALSEGDAEARQQSIEILRRIGATELVKAVQRDLRDRGFAVANTGPRRSTLAHPAGLTRRQLDVLKGLNEGLSNSEIAERLFIAPKTVDHHVSAILAKLDVHSRGEAAAEARKAGWI